MTACCPGACLDIDAFQRSVLTIATILLSGGTFLVLLASS